MVTYKRQCQFHKRSDLKLTSFGNLHGKQWRGGGGRAGVVVCVRGGEGETEGGAAAVMGAEGWAGRGEGAGGGGECDAFPIGWRCQLLYEHS